MIRRILALLVVAAIGFVGFEFAPSISIIAADSAQPQTVTVKARDLQLVCPGAFRVSSTPGKVSSFKPSGSASVVLHQAAESGVSTVAQPSGGTPQTITQANITLHSNNSLQLTATSSSGAGALTQGSAMLTAMQLQVMADANSTGLAATNCQRPGSDLWLVGGDTNTGRESLLILTNPTKVDATVELQLLASNGYLAVPGLSGISVPSQQSIVVPINGLAPKLATFAVHVLARGGSVAAWIQQKTVRGLHPTGVDLIAPTTDAGTALTIPGFLVRGSEYAAKLIASKADYADLTNVLRVSNPGAKQATVLAKITGSNDKTFGTVIQATVAAHSTVDLPIRGLADGDYTIFVSSDQPVRAGAKLNRAVATAKPNTEFAWLPTVLAADGIRVVSVPGSGISKLAIANPGKASIDVAVSGGGINSHFAIAAGADISLRVSGGAVKLNSTGQFAATLLIDISSSIAAVPMVEYANVGGQVSVLVR